MELHWLSVPEHIQFKLAVLVFRCLTDDVVSPVATPTWLLIGQATITGDVNQTSIKQ